MLAKKVLELYADDPKRWTQHAYWRDSAGRLARPSTASCFCLMGAAMSVTENAYEPFRLAVELRFNNSIDMIQWNDAPGRTFEQVKLRLEAACYKPDHNGVMGGDFGQGAGSL